MDLLSVHHDISELELIERYQSTCDQKWLGELYSRYKPLVYGVCLKYLKEVHQAEDASMDIYEHLSEKLKTHQVDNFKSWLYVVVKNHCFQKLRTRTKSLQKEKAANDMYSTTVFHPDNVNKEKRLKKLEKCTENLSQEQKNCITAFYYKSMSYQKIAQKYDLPWHTVRSHIQNGRRNLKKCMDNN